MGKHVEELVVRECKSSEFADCDIVFSGLDSDVSGEIGTICLPLLREISSNLRYRDGVPQSRAGCIFKRKELPYRSHRSTCGPHGQSPSS
jgi:hypothetical protein